jgi:hypothetical protein
MHVKRHDANRYFIVVAYSQLLSVVARKLSRVVHTIACAGVPRGLRRGAAEGSVEHTFTMALMQAKLIPHLIWGKWRVVL